MTNAYALIMAGGAGTRLWPLSRQNKPKPVLNLVEAQRSMFQIAVERLLPLFPPERVLVVANEQLTQQLKAQAPQIPPDNFIVEPSGRDTAPAVGLGALHVYQRDPDAVMAVLTADHYIADENKFREALEAACQMAEKGAIVTLGIEPNYPSTGFGYIERGEQVSQIGDIGVYELTRFAEKPDEETAKTFLSTGNYSWNSGMFIWSVRRILDEFKRHQPEMHADFERIAGSLDKPGYNELLSECWPSIKKISIDFALMEHVHTDIYLIPVEMGWVDIGSFAALHDLLSDGQEAGNVSRADGALLLDTSNTLVHSNRVVATIGLDDIVIIDTDDVLLVCKKDRAQDVKMIVEELRKAQRNHIL